MGRNAEVAHIIEFYSVQSRRALEGGWPRDMAPFTRKTDAYVWHHDYPERFKADFGGGQ